MTEFTVVEQVLSWLVPSALIGALIITVIKTSNQLNREVGELKGTMTTTCSNVSTLLNHTLENNKSRSTT